MESTRNKEEHNNNYCNADDTVSDSSEDPNAKQRARYEIKLAFQAWCYTKNDTEAKTKNDWEGLHHSGHFEPWKMTLV